MQRLCHHFFLRRFEIQVASDVPNTLFDLRVVNHRVVERDYLFVDDHLAISEFLDTFRCHDEMLLQLIYINLWPLKR